MIRLHCPRCGNTCDGSGLADTAALRCSECGFDYPVADGHSWNRTTVEAVANVTRYIETLCDLRTLHPTYFKAAFTQALRDRGWTGPSDHPSRPIPLYPGARIRRVVEIHSKTTESEPS